LLRKEHKQLEKYQQKSKKPDEDDSKGNERARKSQEKLRFHHEEIRKNVTVMIISYYHLDVVCHTNQVYVFILLDMKDKQQRRALPSVDHVPVGNSEDVEDDDDDQDSTVNSTLDMKTSALTQVLIRSLLFSKNNSDGITASNLQDECSTIQSNEIDVCLRIVTKLKPYIPQKKHYSIRAQQLPFCFLCNDILLYIGYTKYTQTLSWTKSATGPNSLSIFDYDNYLIQSLEESLQY
jgi:hypothetical protein